MNITIKPYFYFLVSMLLLLPLTSNAQRQVLTVSPDAMLTLHELNALILEEGDQVLVKLLIPGANASDLKDDEKLLIGDKILFANGESIGKTSELKKIYESLEVGQELSLGIQRGDNRRIIRFIKQEPKENGLKTFVNPVNNGQNNVASTGSEGTQNLRFFRVSSLGITVASTDNGLLITHIHKESLHKDLKGEDLKGYTITSINGEKADSPEDLLNAYNALNEEDTLRMLLVKSDMSKSIEITK